MGSFSKNYFFEELLVRCGLLLGVTCGQIVLASDLCMHYFRRLASFNWISARNVYLYYNMGKFLEIVYCLELD